jgi:hypothetical protein
MSTSEISKFNSLPKPDTIPSLSAKNEWYFDIRYVHLESNPSHFLFLIQPQNGFIHAEKLPLGSSPKEPSYSFFPESGEEAAVEVAPALIRSFVTTLNISHSGHESGRFAPGKLLTCFRNLAKAVLENFKESGVRTELCDVSVASTSISTQADLVFSKYFNALKLARGIKKEISKLIKMPDAIAFRDELDPESEAMDDHDSKVLTYVSTMEGSRPPLKPFEEVTSLEQHQKMMNTYEDVSQRIASKRLQVLKREADEGDLSAAIDYAMRYVSICIFLLNGLCSVRRSRFGIGCKINRKDVRTYLAKAMAYASDNAERQSTIHALLCAWCYQSFTNGIPFRYMFAASHHANKAVTLAKSISPKDVFTPIVLLFGANCFTELSKMAPELLFWYADLQYAIVTRNKQMETATKKETKKRLERPNRYRCANPGCGIEADKGKMLPKCEY